ncbi:olfactory receptor 52N5-like [Sphaeramia orbicularis]|uniref:olfactory receptor 52N5-like n=1 Tax=Sphaeramia orbicularis TaxID=375764 RepID=UPI00117CDA56|nr:olfactory receptor 52N5-like [Sphaeramia orbicularis]
MENWTISMDILHLEGFKVPQESSVPVFILLIYIFIMVANLSLVVLIFRTRSLHQPMYLLFCNLSINDLFGATIIIPHVLRNIFVSQSERYIHYIQCVAQAFCVHLYATCSHTVLMIMAFDRYVAICNPLRYASIMTDKMVIKLSLSAWGVASVLVSILLGLTIRLSRCRWVIFNPYCDNASLFKLSCESVFINQIYGLGFTAVLLSSSIGFITFTYLRITVLCLSSRDKVLNSKALQTCTTHLLVYILLLASGFIIVTLHRFPQLSDHRKMLAVISEAVLPSLNAIIYGLQIKEIKQRIIILFYKSKCDQLS